MNSLYVKSLDDKNVPIVGEFALENKKDC